MGEMVYPKLHVPLVGLHQAENAATAILAAQTLADYGVKCTIDGIYSGVSRVRWPGRAQILQRKPWVLIDGAVTRESTQQICDLACHYPAKRITAVIGVPRPKDLDGVCAEAAKVAERIVLTELPLPTLAWYNNALQIASRYSSDVQFITPVEDAFTTVMAQTQADEGVLLLGTQSFVGSALDFWNVDTCVIW
jgi:dihydrofolate synthase/folylpolyglutamate synthase